jgi:hypothetical protein
MLACRHRDGKEKWPKACEETTMGCLLSFFFLFDMPGMRFSLASGGCGLRPGGTAEGKDIKRP